MKRAIGTAAVALAIAFMPLRATATTPPPSISPSSGTSPVAVWLVMGCAATIIWAAWIANIAQNRQLTPAEANFCGLGYLLRVPRQ
jgi:hypothetical protein